MSGAPLQLQRYEAPCGVLLLGAWRGNLCLCDWLDEDGDDASSPSLKALLQMLQVHPVFAPSEVVRQTVQALDEYFAGGRQSFTELPLLQIGSGFQRRVWHLLRQIPYGATTSYGALAEALGAPSAMRAVAGAGGCNPVSVIVPCHRVIGKDHRLVGYGGGLDAKQFLLDLERRQFHLHFVR